MPGPLLTVVYIQEPDVVFEFSRDGQAREFGRDDECAIVIWSAINGRNLSRRAGRIWRMEGELWLRNLSLRHELYVRAADETREQPLRPRRDASSRGDACSIPAPVATVSGPDGCDLHVHQVHTPPPWLSSDDLPEPTLPQVPEVPPRLRPVATALCEPLLQGSHLPASYREVMVRLGEPSLKTTRRLVGELCEVYAEASPILRSRVLARRLREEEQLGIAHDPTLRAGVWRFGSPPSSAGLPDGEDVRRRCLALPEYVEVARVLVSHFRITADDVAALPRLRREADGG